MLDHEIELGLDHDAIDIFLQREAKNVAEFISEQMADILKGLEEIILKVI